MKNRFFKYVLFIMAGLFFATSLSSCGSSTKYLKGDVCGTASVDGTNAFSEIRRYYCEQFVYEANVNFVAEDGTYASLKDIYTAKFELNEAGNLEVVTYTEEEATRYLQAHYLFTYYDKDYEHVNFTKVETYVANNVEESKQADCLTLMNKLASGTDITNKYAYFPKIRSTDYDSDEVTVNDVTVSSVKTRMTSHSKACLVFTDGFTDPATGVNLTKTTWKDAWNVGLLYGLFVFPMALLINLFVTWFGSSGWAQVGAILLVTVLLKLLILLLTFKSQTSSQKMQDIQPEILAIQSKYGQNPAPEDKQRMSMEMMAVYQKYGVKPLAPFASLLITFPVFIAMYRAVMYLGVLRTGNIFGVILGNNLSTYIIGGSFNWFALVIFILMAGSQILSMKLPQILNSKRMSDDAKKQQKQANTMTNVMMIMILVMGFMMPVTMSIYWIASALVGTIQSVIMHKLNNSSKNGRYKVKKAEETYKIPQGYKK